MRKAKKYLNDNNIHYDTLNGKVKSMIEKILGYTDNEDTIHIIDKVNMNGGRVVLPKEYFDGGRVVLPKEYFDGGRVVLPKEYFDGGRVVLPKEYFNGGRVVLPKEYFDGGRVVLPKEYFNGGNIYNTKKYLLRLKKYISMRGGKLSMSKELEKQINENMELLLLNSIVDKSHDKKTITVKSLNDSAKLLKSICKF